MAYEDVLVHTATPYYTTVVPDDEDTTDIDESNWIEGEPDDTGNTPSPGGGAAGTPFACCLFLPQSPEQGPPRGRRVVRVPTLLMAPEDNEGTALMLSPADTVSITAPELPGHANGVLYQVEGEPQPFGPPGDDLIGMQATLKRVED